ncbi:MAG: hypothetical protein U1F68_16585 [Gammaproteobacteria bacterium]
MTALALPTTSALFQKQSNATNENAEKIAEMLMDVAYGARSRATDWHPIVNALIVEIASECQNMGWDGYNAKPIPENAIRQAQRFADLLPSHLLEPDLVPDPDGEIAFSWDLGQDRVFTVNVSASGTLYYAGLIGKGVKRHGMEPFKDDVPKIIIETIEELENKFGPVPGGSAK